MFWLQSHLRKRVSGKSIKTGRNQQQVWVEFYQAVKRPLDRRRVLSRVASRRDWPVEDVAPRLGAAARITRILVNRRKTYSVVPKNDFFGAVPVVRIEVPDPNPFATCCQRVMGGNRDRVQIAKTHRSGRSCVMAGRTH